MLHPDAATRRPGVEPNQPRPEDGYIATQQPLKNEQKTNDSTPEGPTTPGIPTVPTAEGKALALAVANAADSKKAEDIVILEIAHTLGIADYFVICTATSRKHAQVVAEHCHDIAHGMGAVTRPLSGVQQGSWVCGDFGDVVLHVFIEETRKFYDLESLHADAARLEFTPSGNGAPAPPVVRELEDSLS